MEWRSVGEGVGASVVYVHGLEDSWVNWSSLAAHVHRPGLAADLPWRAGSAHDWALRGTPGSIMAEAFAVLPEPPETVVAHSFGANAVLEMMAAGGLPRSVDQVVLLAPFFRPPSLLPDWDLHTAALAGVRRVMAAGVRLRMGGRAERVDPDVLDTMAGMVVDRIGPLGFGAFFRTFVATTHLNLSTVDVPVLVLVGADDECLDAERAAALTRTLTTARIEVRAHYSHFCHIEQADDIAAELTASTPLTGVPS